MLHPTSTVSAVLPHCVDRFPFSGQKDFLPDFILKENLERISFPGPPNGLGIFFRNIPLRLNYYFPIAKFGTTVLAAYQVANNFSSLAYMFPFVLLHGFNDFWVGTSVGAEEYARARKIPFCRITALSYGFHTYIPYYYFSCAKQIASIYSGDIDVITTAGHFPDLCRYMADF